MLEVSTYQRESCATDLAVEDWDKNAILDGCSTVDSMLDYDGIRLYSVVFNGILLLNSIHWYSMVLHGIRWYCRILHGI